MNKMLLFVLTAIVALSAFEHTEGIPLDSSHPGASSPRTAEEEAKNRPVSSSLQTAAGVAEFQNTSMMNETVHLKNDSSHPVTSSPQTAAEKAKSNPVASSLQTAMGEAESQCLTNEDYSQNVINFTALNAAGEKFALYLERLEQEGTGCSCEDNSCSCCVDLRVPEIGLDDSACLTIKFLSQDIGVFAALEWNGKAVFEENVSLRNPPPICIGVPGLRKALGLCVRFGDISIEPEVSFCIYFEFHVFFVNVYKLKLGCPHF